MDDDMRFVRIALPCAADAWAAMMIGLAKVYPHAHVVDDAEWEGFSVIELGKHV